MRTLLITIMFALVFAGVASGSPTVLHRFYVDELRMGNNIESKGIQFNGRHVNVDTASCIGLRRYGVKADEFGLDKFWKFSCDLFNDVHSYTARITTTREGTRWYWTVNRVVMGY